MVTAWSTTETWPDGRAPKMIGGQHGGVLTKPSTGEGNGKHCIIASNPGSMERQRYDAERLTLTGMGRCPSALRRVQQFAAVTDTEPANKYPGCECTSRQAKSML